MRDVDGEGPQVADFGDGSGCRSHPVSNSNLAPLRERLSVAT